jgi:hypothetical protein
MAKELPNTIVNTSGGGSLYGRQSFSVSETGRGGVTINVKINKKLTIEVHYDYHALSGFSMSQIIDDFWGNVNHICIEEGYSMDGSLLA